MIPGFVYKTMRRVRESAQANMFDSIAVIRLAQRIDERAADWLRANKDTYMEVLNTMMDWQPSGDQRSTRERITAAFKALRKHKMITRQNFMCCGGCASCALAQQADKSVAAGRTVIGAVYYHRQNNQYFENSGILYLSYGAVDVPGQTDAEEIAANTKIGNLIAESMRAEGLAVEWDGNPVKCIVVTEA